MNRTEKIINFFKNSDEYSILDFSEYTYCRQRLKIIHNLCNTLFIPTYDRFFNKGTRCPNKECKKQRKENTHLKKYGYKVIFEKDNFLNDNIKVLQKRYGVNNAYKLAKYSKISKPQFEIFKYLQNKFKKLKFEKEKQKLCYRVDIICEDINLVIEFNGSYWHCDPRLYEEKFFNKRKNKIASEIWEYDKNRINDLINIGYDVIIIWEKDYKENREQILSRLVEEINDRKN